MDEDRAGCPVEGGRGAEKSTSSISTGACKINARCVWSDAGPLGGCGAKFGFLFQARPAPRPPQDTMLKETEWIGSCKINARICFDLPGLRCSTLYNGGLGVARGTSAAKEKTSLPEQGSVWPQDTTSVYFASTGTRIRWYTGKPGRRGQSGHDFDRRQLVHTPQSSSLSSDPRGVCHGLDTWP